MVIGIPRLARILRRFAIVDSFAEEAHDAVGDQEESGEAKDRADEVSHPSGGMVSTRGNGMGCGSFDEHADEEEGKPKKKGFPAVDGSGTLRGVIQ